MAHKMDQMLIITLIHPLNFHKVTVDASEAEPKQQEELITKAIVVTEVIITTRVDEAVVDVIKALIPIVVVDKELEVMLIRLIPPPLKYGII